jgi:hypothetical protein
MRPTDDLLRELRAHLPEGSDDPYPASLLARDLGVSERTVGQLVGELIDRGELIGSSCGPHAGYFLIRNLAELEEGTRHIVARARASFDRVSKLRRAAEERFGDVARLFELEEVSV